MSDTRPQESSPSHAPGGDAPPHRYNAALAQAIESRWQTFWRDHKTFRTSNPGEAGFDATRPKQFVLDMFPYPSGVGLHVGHPLGYIATDIYARYLRMAGYNVLHTMGFDAFGLPAEQFALQTGTHPRVSTEANIATMRQQLERLGLGHDPHRSVSTTDPEFYKWTQWIFLQIYNSWYDEEAEGTEGQRDKGTKGKARPISELVKEFESGRQKSSSGRAWAELSTDEQRGEIDNRRLAYLAEVPVNWCPKLGTVLANEEVTADGRSERGNFPVYKRPLRQWMMRITAYAQRLLEDLEKVDWPEPIKLMQRNWIGRSEGAWIDFALASGTPSLRDGSTPDAAVPAEEAPHGRAARYDLRDLAARFATLGGRTLTPVGFVGRDPYPKGIYGPVRDLVRTQRYLPHLNLPGATYFVTWKTIEGKPLSDTERQATLDALLHFDGERCRTYAAVVMSNHVHWIVRPFEGTTLDSLVENVKRFSATQINKGRGVQGYLWDPERFDHIIRDLRYFDEFLRYVVGNPVEAGVARQIWEYPAAFIHSEAVGAVGCEGSTPVSERRGTQSHIRVFTTRPDTLFGATYMVLSPEHPMVDQLVPASWDSKQGPIPEEWRGVFPGAPKGGFATPRAAVDAYRAFARSKTDEQRQEAKDKTGVFTGAYAANPGTGQPIPIFIADYVLMGYGTGAIMAVPAHDERDFDFASAMNLPIRDVVYPRQVLAMKHFAEWALPAGAPAPVNWKEQLADFLGLTSVSADDARFAILMTLVRERRQADQPAPGSAKRGTIRAVWLKAIDELDVQSFEELRALFAGAAYYKKQGKPFTGEGFSVNSSGPTFSLTGLATPAAKHAAAAALQEQGQGRSTVTYKLRDWLFSRQRYWGEPFPIVYDEQGHAHALPESMLPLLLPELSNFQPETSDDPDAPVRTPLNRAKEWVSVTLDLGESGGGGGPKKYTRETNTMPNWAGSCWYYLRYLDSENAKTFCDPVVERYWMAGLGGPPLRGGSGETESGASHPPRSGGPPIGGVDLYVGGVEHAVLHLLYARFWHKILFDLGHVSTPEPFQKLFNQGYIQAAAYKDRREVYVPASDVAEGDEVGVPIDDVTFSTGAHEPIMRSTTFSYKGEPVFREYGKMGKSLKNAVSPDEIFEEYGCDTMRVYEMAMGPLEASKPWNTRDIAGSHRFLQRVWRNLIDESTGQSRCVSADADRATLRVLHKTIIGVRRDMESLGFNTVVSKLIELNNHLSALAAVPLQAAAPLILMLTPLAPHIGEELWHRVMRAAKHKEAAPASILYERFPIADENLAKDDQVEIPVSINGKLRSKVSVPAGSDAAAIEAAAKADARVIELIEGKPIKKVIVVPGRMVNFVV
jgi:leucyl-tRNA synthetase